MAKRKVLCGILAQHTGKTLKQIYKVTAKGYILQCRGGRGLWPCGQYR